MDPFRTVQRGIAAAAAAMDGPDVVRVESGVYDTPGVDLALTVPQNQFLESLAVLGGFDSTFTTQSPRTTVYIPQSPSNINAADVDVSDPDVTFDGFHFVFDGQQGGGGARQSAGILSRTSGLTLNNNLIEAPSSTFAVQTVSGSDQSGLTLTNNLIHADAQFSSGGVYINPGSNNATILIDGNTVTGTNLSQGIAVDTMSNVTVSNNDVSRTANGGLQLIFAGTHSGDGFQSGIVISGNTVDSNRAGGAGIEVGDTNPVNPNAALVDVQLLNNTVRDNTSGIRIDFNVVKATVQGGSIEGNATGLVSDGADTLLIGDVKLKDNTSDGTLNDTPMIVWTVSAGILGQSRFNGTISGFTFLFKQGDGNLVLTGSNPYTGSTTVQAGELQVDGVQPNCPITVDGGILSGTGRVGDVILNPGGQLSPGPLPGILTVGSVNFNGGIFTVTIIGALPGSQYAFLNVTGNVTFTGPPQTVLNLFVPVILPTAVGTQLVIVNNAGPHPVMPVGGPFFEQLPEGATVTLFGEAFRITYVGGDGNDIVLTHINTPPVVHDPTITPATIPEGPPPANEVTITGSFTDPDTLDAHTVIIDWGDGGTSAVVLAPGDTTYGDDGTPVTHRYLDNLPGNAPYTVTVSVFDGSGGAGTNNNGRVTVLNVPPVAMLLGAPKTSPEGTPITLASTATDVGVLDAAAGFTFNWTVTKNGNAFAMGTGAQFTFTPDDNGTYVVSLTATDKDGGVSAPVTATITATNVEPSGLTITFNPATVPENTPVTLNSTFFDPGVLDSHTVIIDWGDGTTPDTIMLAANVLQFSAMHTYPQNQPSDGVFNVVVTVTDKDGGTTTKTTPFTVTNVPPVITMLEFRNAGNQVVTQITENDTVTLNGTFTDPGIQDKHTVTVNWGDGTADTVLDLAANVLTFTTPAHPYLQNKPYPDQNNPTNPFVITVTIQDRRADNTLDGGTDITTRNLQVLQAPPRIDSLGLTLLENEQTGPRNLTSLTVNEGQTVVFTGTIKDVGTQDVLTATVEWNDGTADTFSIPPSGVEARTFRITHTYLQSNGAVPNVQPVPSNIRITVHDEDTPQLSTSNLTQNPPLMRTVLILEKLLVNPGSIQNDPNSGATVAFDPNTGFVTVANQLVATFADAGRAELSPTGLPEYVARVNWGDGLSDTADPVADNNQGPVKINLTTAVQNGRQVPVFNVTGSHVYSGPGTFTITVCVYDRDLPDPTFSVVDRTFKTQRPTVFNSGSTSAQSLLTRILLDRAGPLAGMPGKPLEGNVFTQVVQSNAAKITLSQDPQVTVNAIRVVLNSQQFFIRTVRNLYMTILQRDPVANVNGVAFLVNPTFNNGEPFLPSPATPESILRDTRTQVVFSDPGAVHWIQFLAQGNSTDQLRAMLVGSTEFRTNIVPIITRNTVPAGLTLTPLQEYVNAIYVTLLGRPALQKVNGQPMFEPAANGWVQQLQNGVSGSTVAFSIQASLEGRRFQVNNIYLLYLKRQADPSGLSSFVHLLMTGGTESQVIQGIVNSPEYFRLVTSGG
jgi:autotransporter-associated beta strand protein